MNHFFFYRVEIHIKILLEYVKIWYNLTIGNWCSKKCCTLIILIGLCKSERIYKETYFKNT